MFLLPSCPKIRLPLPYKPECPLPEKLCCKDPRFPLSFSKEPPHPDTVLFSVPRIYGQNRLFRSNSALNELPLPLPYFLNRQSPRPTSPLLPLRRTPDAALPNKDTPRRSLRLYKAPRPYRIPSRRFPDSLSFQTPHLQNRGLAPCFENFDLNRSSDWGNPPPHSETARIYQ